MHHAVNVMEEQICGAISVPLVSKVKLGMKDDAVVINSYNQEHVVRMIIKILILPFKLNKTVVNVEEGQFKLA